MFFVELATVSHEPVVNLKHMIRKCLNHFRIIEVAAHLHDVSIELLLGVLNAQFLLVLRASYRGSAAANRR